jgi:glycosyltransferase involved in cell wall biosynthesis
MKIVFANDIIHGYACGAAVVGGAERQQWLIARALAGRGWKVTVGVRKPLATGDRQVIDGVEFVGIGEGQIHGSWFRLLATARPDWWYWRCANHLWGSAVELAKMWGVRTIFAAGFDNDVQPRRALFRRSRWWPLYAWGLSRTDRIFVQHTGQLSGLTPRWQPKARIVRSIAGELPPGSPHSERAKYVAWVAMLRQPKRPDVLLQIARRIPDVRFVVCGAPASFRSVPGYSELVAAALQTQPNVEFLGKVPPQKAREVIGNAAMLLSTSDTEGFPNTFLEAWSSGTPVVSLRIDPDGIIQRHQLGTVSGTVERAATDIVALMESPRQREDIAARSRHYVAEAHSESTIVATFKQALEGA